ncbi:hypothetical protein GCM10018773_34980 [Streptomyces candidus]|nr:hypothetical protein GCM10018773_34980 [Streptomyces candidus]
MERYSRWHRIKDTSEARQDPLHGSAAADTGYVAAGCTCFMAGAPAAQESTDREPVGGRAVTAPEARA